MGRFNNLGFRWPPTVVGQALAARDYIVVIENGPSLLKLVSDGIRPMKSRKLNQYLRSNFAIQRVAKLLTQLLYWNTTCTWYNLWPAGTMNPLAYISLNQRYSFVTIFALVRADFPRTETHNSRWFDRIIIFTISRKTVPYSSEIPITNYALHTEYCMPYVTFNWLSDISREVIWIKIIIWIIYHIIYALYNHSLI